MRGGAFQGVLLLNMQFNSHDNDDSMYGGGESAVAVTISVVFMILSIVALVITFASAYSFLFCHVDNNLKHFGLIYC